MEKLEFIDFTLTEEEKQEVNRTFTPYLFYKHHKSGEIECFCSSCNEHYTEPAIKRTMRPRDYDFRGSLQHKNYGFCLKCDRKATTIDTVKAQKCRSLCETQRIVLIRCINENRVMAQSYYCHKNYNKDLYTPRVIMNSFRQYDIKPGDVTVLEKDKCYGHIKNVNVKEPFNKRVPMRLGYFLDNSYTILNINSLENSFLRYHQLDFWLGTPVKEFYGIGTDYELNAMKYICQFAIYPIIEKIQKLGFGSLVKMLINEKNKGGDSLNWEADNIQDFFKLTKKGFKDMREFIFKENIPDTAKALMPVVRVFQCFNKIPGAGLSDVVFWDRQINGMLYLDELVGHIKRNKLPLIRTLKYINKQAVKNKESFHQMSISYRDYIDIVKKYKLGKGEEVIYPPHLPAAHDRAAEIQNAYIAEELAKTEKAKMEKYQKIHSKNLLNYEFEFKGFCFIIPKNSAEIVNEGKIQNHCVGGYADRHLEGKLTIVFMRKANIKHTPLYTIEMQGDSMRQVQGKGDRTPLTLEAKKVFNIWLGWVQKGSPRDENGVPILEEEKIKMAV